MITTTFGYVFFIKKCKITLFAFVSIKAHKREALKKPSIWRNNLDYSCDQQDRQTYLHPYWSQTCPLPYCFRCLWLDSALAWYNVEQFLCIALSQMRSSCSIFFGRVFFMSSSALYIVFLYWLERMRSSSMGQYGSDIGTVWHIDNDGPWLDAPFSLLMSTVFFMRRFRRSIYFRHNCRYLHKELVLMMSASGALKR